MSFIRFLKCRSGNFAVITAITALPLLLAAGLSVDYTRHSAAQKHLQELADAASISLATQKDDTREALIAKAEDVIQSNLADDRIDVASVVDVDSDNDRVQVQLSGNIQASFMKLGGYDILPVKADATAERALMGTVEVALVLDNTYSMKDDNDTGVTKIETLKTAAATLVDKLMTNEDDAVRIALVPYADYVNVGTQHRGASWLSVPADYEVAKAPRTCETRTTRSRCLETEPKYACTKVIDGIEEQSTCGGGCKPGMTQTYNVEPYEYCTGGGNPTQYKWYGCIGSRKAGTDRLHDRTPSSTYPGYVETSQKCLNPIVPLTNDKTTVTNAIAGMIINIGGYKPFTYIPAGLIWGLNVLSPTAPFGEGAAYHLGNKQPRKVVVLMTDGENTLRFRASDGRHISANATQITNTTNKDTLSICTEIKTQGIEIFSVAFMVDNEAAKTMLESCATSTEHYYDASDTTKLVAAFSGIADSLRVVRLVR